MRGSRCCYVVRSQQSRLGLHHRRSKTVLRYGLEQVELVVVENLTGVWLWGSRQGLSQREIMLVREVGPEEVDSVSPKGQSIKSVVNESRGSTFVPFGRTMKWSAMEQIYINLYLLCCVGVHDVGKEIDMRDSPNVGNSRSHRLLKV